MSYSSEVLADSPLAYYRLGDASGTTAVDSSGNGRNGTYSGSPTLGATGLLTGDSDTAVSFNGNLMSTTSASWMNVGTAFTVEAWIKTSTSTQFREIVARYTNSTTRSWEFRINSTTGALEFIHIGAGVTVTGVGSIRDNSVHHCVATYDGTTIRVYVDGSQQNTGAATAALTNSGDLRIAQRAADLSFVGTIDEVAVYGTALSATRIAAHYNAGTGVSGTSASGSGSLSLSGSGAGGADDSGSGSLTLAASGAGGADDSGAGSLSLSASGTAVGPGQAVATASLTLSASSTAVAVVDGSAAIIGLAAGVAAGASGGTGSLDLTASMPVLETGDAVIELLAGGVAVPLYVTDTSNALDGLDLMFTALVTVTRPVSAPTVALGEKYDKAVPYPVPVLVDGRPT